MIDYTLPLDQLPDPLPIEPLRKPFDVTITPPGSKSITCRAYVLAALAKGESKIIRPLRADDPDYLLEALCTLGAEARWVPGEDHDGEDVYIKGVGGRFPRGGNLYMGDGGAPTRFMIACACLAAEPVVIDASPRMRERPIAEGVEMLRQLGAKIEYVEEEGRLPVRVVPSKLVENPTIRGDGTASSQFITAIMLIAPWIDFETHILLEDVPVSRSYLDLTDEVLIQWGYDPQGDEVQVDLYRYDIRAQDYSVEPDASSAAYWFAAAAMGAGSRMAVPQVAGSRQPDICFPVDVLESFGMICFGDQTDRSIVLEGTGGHGCEDREVNRVDMAEMPDATLAAAVVCARQSYSMRLVGLGSLRVKETDRIAALANELRKIGCAVETGEDWIEITPPSASPAMGGVVPADRLEPRGRDEIAQRGSRQERRVPRHPDADPVVIETYNDHRMAMAFAVLGLVRPGISIRSPACVSKSYPGFWKDFAKLYQ